MAEEKGRIYKRKSVYWIDFMSENGNRIRKSAKTGNKKYAKIYLEQQIDEDYRVHVLGEEPEKLFEEAVVLFLKEGLHQKDFKKKQLHAKYWLSQFQGRKLSSIRSSDILENLPSFNEEKNIALTTAEKSAISQNESQFF